MYMYIYIFKVIPSVSHFEFSVDGKTVFYTQPDQLKRPSKVFAHMLGDSSVAVVVVPEENDVLLYHEPDHSYFVDIHRTKDRVIRLQILLSSIFLNLHVSIIMNDLTFVYITL